MHANHKNTSHLSSATSSGAAVSDLSRLPLSRSKVLASSGAMMCAAACSAPLLLAATGITWGASSWFFQGSELAGVLILTVGLGGMLWHVISRSSRENKPVSIGGCGCDSNSSPSTDFDTDAEGLVCTLPASEHAPRMQEYQSLFQSAYLDSQRLDGGRLRWRFRGDAAFYKRLRSLAGKEQECCQFFHFRIVRKEDEVWWEMWTGPEAQATLEDFYQLPRALASTEPGTLVKKMVERFENSGGKINC